MQKIKYIKIIVPLLAIVFIAGFFVWHLIWMTDISVKHEQMILSGEVSNIVKPEKTMKHKRKSKTKATGKTGENEIESHQENQYQSIPAEGRRQINAKSERRTDIQKTQITRLGTEIPVNETDRETINFSNHDKLDSRKSNRKLNQNKNNSFSTTRKNRTLSTTLKNRLNEEPVEKLDGPDISTAQHPTSTTPY